MKMFSDLHEINFIIVVEDAHDFVLPGNRTAITYDLRVLSPHILLNPLLLPKKEHNMK